MRLCFTPPVSPNVLSKSGGVRVSHPTTRSLNPGAYCSIVSNTAGGGRKGGEKGRGRREEGESGRGREEEKEGGQEEEGRRRGKGVRRKKEEQRKEEQKKGKMFRRICDNLMSNRTHLANRVPPHQHQCTVSSSPLSILLLPDDREYTV